MNQTPLDELWARYRNLEVEHKRGVFPYFFWILESKFVEEESDSLTKEEIVNCIAYAISPAANN